MALWGYKTAKIISLKDNKSMKNGTLFSLFSFINRGFSFLIILVLASYITPAEYGYLSLFGTVVMVIGYLMAMSIEGYLSVTYFKDGSGGIKKAFSCILFTSLIVASFLLVIISLYGEKIGELLNLNKSILYFAVIICFFTVFTNVNLDLYRIQEKVKIYGVFSCTNAILNFAISILFVKTFLLGWQGRVYAQAICFSLFGIIGILSFASRGYLSLPDKNFWKGMLAWGVPLIPHLATTFIRQGCDRYIINYSYSIEDVGLFSFALNMANIIGMIGVGFNQINSVNIYKTLSNNSLDVELKRQHLKKEKDFIFKIYMVSSIFVAFGICIFTPILLPKYAGSVPYMPLLALSSFLHCLYYLYTNFLFYYNKTKTIMLVTLSCSIIHLILSLLLTRYSLYLTCIVYCVSQLLIFLFIKKKSLEVLDTNLK
jgi:O-antigen/teichoic acid export membrane protein